VPISDDSDSLGKVEIRLKNPWRMRIEGQVALHAEGILLTDESQLRFALSPGATSATKIGFSLLAQPTENAPRHFTIERDADGRRFRYVVPVRQTLEIPYLTSESDSDTIAALSEIPPHRVISSGGQHCADVAFACSSRHFLLLARVADCRKQRGPQIWDGSCIEVFLTANPAVKANQFFLAPPAADLPAQGFRLQTSEGPTAIVPAPEVSVICEEQADGYRLFASIPLGKIAEAPMLPAKFYFEIVLTTGLDTSTFSRIALFGSSAPVQNTGFYAMAECNPPLGR
jgi:hypothetical protein